MTDKENARELYNALDRVLDLIKSGKIKSPSLKKVLGDRSVSSLPIDSHGSSLWPDLWKNLSPEQWGDMEILMVLAKVEARAGSTPKNLRESGAVCLAFLLQHFLGRAQGETPARSSRGRP